MLGYILGAVLIGVIITVIAGANIGINLLKVKYADRPELYQAARTGILWAAAICILIASTSFIATIGQMIMADPVLATVLGSIVVCSMYVYACQSRSYLLLLIVFILSVGLAEGIWHDLPKTTSLVALVMIIAIAVPMLIFATNEKTDDTDLPDEELPDPQPPLENPTFNMHQTIGRRHNAASPTISPDEQSDTAQEITLQQSSRGLAPDNGIPRPYEPVLRDLH